MRLCLAVAKIFLLSIVVGSVVSLALGGCSAARQAGTPLNVTLLFPKAPALIPALMAEKNGSEKLKLKVETWDTIEQLLARIQTGDAPLVAAPLNLGANVAAKGLPLQLLHVNTWGSMYLVSRSADVQSLSDLADGAVHIPGQGGPPDILTRYLLEQEGLTGKVGLAYSAMPDIVQQLAAGTVRHAVLPEPVLSGLRAKLEGELRVIVDFQQAWQDIHGTDLPQAGIFVNRPWAEAHPEQVELFQQMYREAVRETVRQPGEALALAAEAFALPEAVLAEAMNRMSLAFATAAEAREEVERYFDVLLRHAPDSIGGRLPDADFYYGL